MFMSIYVALALMLPVAWSAGTSISQSSVPPASDFPQSTAQTIKGGPFTLTNHIGKTVTEQAFKGDFVLIFFGYTHCPDVCPADLMVMTQALELLGEDADRVQPLFITFDPQRDDRERMADYVQNFHPRLIGLTGTKEQTLAAANYYGVDVSATYQAEQPGSAYSMNHSAFTYLVDPNGELRVMFRTGTSPELMAQTIHKHLYK
jgi:protein SCO1/2